MIAGQPVMSGLEACSGRLLPLGVTARKLSEDRGLLVGRETCSHLAERRGAFQDLSS
jgi:hypothetical protein